MRIVSFEDVLLFFKARIAMLYGHLLELLKLAFPSLILLKAVSL